MIINGHSHVILPVQKHIQLMDEAGVKKVAPSGCSFRFGKRRSASLDLRYRAKFCLGRRRLSVPNV